MKSGQIFTLDEPPDSINVELFAEDNDENKSRIKKWFEECKLPSLDNQKKRVIVPIMYSSKTVGRIITTTVKEKNGSTLYEAHAKSYFPVSPQLSMTLDKSQGQTLKDGVILAIAERKNIRRLIDFEKFYVSLTRVEVGNRLRFLINDYSELAYLTTLTPKPYLNEFIDFLTTKKLSSKDYKNKRKSIHLLLIPSKANAQN